MHLIENIFRILSPFPRFTNSKKTSRFIPGFSFSITRMVFFAVLHQWKTTSNVCLLSCSIVSRTTWAKPNFLLAPIQASVGLFSLSFALLEGCSLGSDIFISSSSFLSPPSLSSPLLFLCCSPCTLGKSGTEKEMS